MFSIGEKIVCVKQHSSGVLVVDKIYTVGEVSACCKGQIVNVGIDMVGGVPITKCSVCDKHFDRIFFGSWLFVPLSEYSANETAVNELVKESVKNIYQK